MNDNTSNIAKLSVKEIETRLDYLIETDIHNPEIYELLKTLATIFIFQNKYVYGQPPDETVI